MDSVLFPQFDSDRLGGVEQYHFYRGMVVPLLEPQAHPSLTLPSQEEAGVPFPFSS